MDYKPSRYNLVYEDNGSAFIYNTRTNNLARLPNHTLQVAQKLGHTSALDWIEAEPSRFSIDDAQLFSTVWDQLISGGFLISDDIDELEALRVSSRVARHSMESLALTLVVTHRCNFSCPYCYEDRTLPRMGKQVQDQLVRFVHAQAKELKNLGITWFGGEPLVAMPVIERLSLAMISIATKHNINYGADIITNGYRLTRDMAQNLVELGIQSAQVTLDGMPATHDRRRPLASGEPTFDKILQNILASNDVINITLRINVDPSNLDSAYELVDYLAAHDLPGKVTLSLAPIHNDGKGCADRADAWGPNGEPIYQNKPVEAGTGDKKVPSLYSLRQFSEERTRFYQYTLERGFPFVSLPTSKSHACTADLGNSYVVEPDGTLQKCWQTVSNPSEKIGDVFRGTTLNKNYTKWLLFEPFQLDKCRSCRVLPVCMGWCPRKIMADPSPESCNVLKHTIVEDLKMYCSSEKRN
jgi:uncharacterized protein